MAMKKKSGKWRARTLAVRGGQMRSEFQETAEALFLTSGYAYDAPEQAEARFKGTDEGFIYSRYGKRHGCRHCHLSLRLAHRRSCGGGARDVRRLPLCDRRRADALRHHPHAGGWR